MRYCPRCEVIVKEPESEVCPGCGCVLQSLDTLPEEDRDRPVVLTYCETSLEAALLTAVLEAEGITAAVENEGLFEAVNPWRTIAREGLARVMVRLEDAEAALDLLRRKDAGELAISEDDVPEEDDESEESEEAHPGA